MTYVRLGPLGMTFAEGPLDILEWDLELVQDSGQPSPQGERLE